MGNIEDLVKKGEYNNALTSIDELLVEDEYNIELLTLKAQILYKQGLFAGSIDIYNVLINLIPKNAEYYAGRGLSYHGIGESQTTLDDLTTAIELDTENGFRFASRAFIKDYIGDSLGAMDDYNKAIELDPEDGVSLNNRGIIEEKLGRMHLAQESFDTADKLSGADNSLKKSVAKPSKATHTKERKVNFKSFFSVIKDIISSSEVRKEFYNFLIKQSRKGNN